MQTIPAVVPFTLSFIGVASTSDTKRSRDSSRAVLISGPPGIGKTTCVEVCCRQAGYELIQLNASDKRNMSFVRDTLKDSTSIMFCFCIGCECRPLSFEKKRIRKAILMDEVDGMSSGDRGGIQELVGFFAIPEIDPNYQNHADSHYLY